MPRPIGGAFRGPSARTSEARNGAGALREAAKLKNCTVSLKGLHTPFRLASETRCNGAFMRA